MFLTSVVMPVIFASPAWSTGPPTVEIDTIAARVAISFAVGISVGRVALPVGR